MEFDAQHERLHEIAAAQREACLRAANDVPIDREADQFCCIPIQEELKSKIVAAIRKLGGN